MTMVLDWAHRVHARDELLTLGGPAMVEDYLQLLRWARPGVPDHALLLLCPLCLGPIGSCIWACGPCFDAVVARDRLQARSDTISITEIILPYLERYRPLPMCTQYH